MPKNVKTFEKRRNRSKLIMVTCYLRYYDFFNQELYDNEQADYSIDDRFIFDPDDYSILLDLFEKIDNGTHPAIAGILGQLEMGKEEHPHFHFLINTYYSDSAIKIKKYFKELMPHCDLVSQSEFYKVRNYVTKNKGRIGKIYKFGIIEHQGCRNDIYNVKQDIMNGVFKTYRQVEASYPSITCKFDKYLRNFFVEHNQKNLIGEFPEIEIYYGTTGTGKSMWVNQEYPNAYHVKIPENPSLTFWWSGYDSQNEIVFEDFNCQVIYRELLQILDGYTYKVKIGVGLMVPLKSKKIIFTTHKHPKEWYEGRLIDKLTGQRKDNINNDELFRRLKERATIYNCYNTGSGQSTFKIEWKPTPSVKPNITIKQRINKSFFD